MHTARTIVRLSIGVGLALALPITSACFHSGDDSISPPSAVTPQDSPPAMPTPAPPPVTQPTPQTTMQPAAPRPGRGNRLAAVRARGMVICAGLTDGRGFGFIDERGTLTGFDVDLCRAVAAAALGNPDAFEWREVAFADRGAVIQAGEIDLLTIPTAWTTRRDAEWGDFAPTMLYEGQGFLVKRGTNITSALQLSGATVCVAEGTTTQVNLEDFSRTNAMNIVPVTFQDFFDTSDAYLADRCAALTSSRVDLASRRLTFPDPEAHVLLTETISEDPLGHAVPHGDSLWFDIVKTVMSMLIYAEAYGVTSTTVPTTLTGDVKVDRLFGLDSTYGQASLGLDPMTAQAVIRAVGNYGEIYDRHLGPAGLGIPRENSRNALWADAPCTDCPKGGQIYAAPPQ